MQRIAGLALADGGSRNYDAAYVRRAYTCQQSPRCDAGVQPAGSKEWTKLDPCKD